MRESVNLMEWIVAYLERPNIDLMVTRRCSVGSSLIYGSVAGSMALAWDKKVCIKVDPGRENVRQARGVVSLR
jgi:hypothetical protein